MFLQNEECENFLNLSVTLCLYVDKADMHYLYKTNHLT